jgi:branched-chain amino acid transport system permease protein
MTDPSAHPLPLNPAADGRSYWLTTLRSNLLVPVVLLLLVAIGHYVENPDHLDPYKARIVMLIGINITLAVSLQLINGISGQFSLGHAGFMAVGAYLAGYPSSTYSNDLRDPAGVVLFYAALAVAAGLVAAFVGVLFFLISQSKRLYSNLPLILLALVVAWFVWDVARAADFEAGHVPAHLVWSRLIQFVGESYAWVIEHGTPAATWLNDHLPQTGRKPLTFLVLILGGGLCAAVAGLLIGLPTLRLRGDYLAIATLGFAEIIRVVITNAEPLGGATGLSVPVYPFHPRPEEVAEGLKAYHLFPWVYGVAFITTLAIWRLQHSAKGRAIAAVREDEIAAAAVGVDPTRTKVLAFIAGAFFAGTGGAVFAHYDGYLNPNSFSLMRSIEIVVMVTLGGLGSIPGAILAAVGLTILPEALRAFSEYRMIVYSVLLIVVMLARAGGFGSPRALWRRLSRAPAAGATAT